ncbi:hypothetical protein [Mycobacterium sp. DL592]|uniref:hypothetical protein n=1 Tax=Mycobacterium sp. DL592 TaxID=2675524 RepID=UPI001422B5F4|nr:hypothetical protein [Mycobacterium sp. DL592]
MATEDTDDAAPATVDAVPAGALLAPGVTPARALLPAVVVRAVCPALRAGPAADDESELPDPLSAHASAGRAAIPTPTPNAIAKPPTRPTYRA